ncbi:MAG: redoxin domain-containing protein [Bacteroidales bacterium]|jgi:thiol-disulfide isomerase/thioredoxin|nr:redoxin domain-containing protein [Bacteroidales bacterium]
MKQTTLIISILSFFFVSNFTYAQKSKNAYEITIKIKNSTDSIIYLANYYGKNQYLKDSAKVDPKNPGTYVFRGEEPLPGGVYIIASQGKARLLEFLVDKNQKFTFETDTLDYLKNIKVKNSPENEAFFDYIKTISNHQMQLSKLNSEYKTAKEGEQKELAKSLKKEITEKQEEIENFTINYIEKNKDLFLSRVLSLSREVKVPEYPKLEDGTVDSTFGWRYYKQNYWMYVDLTDDRLLRTPVFHNKLQNYFENVIVQDNDSIKKEVDWMIEQTRPNDEMFKYSTWFLTNFYETSKIMGFDEIFVYIVEKYYMTNQCTWVAPHTLENLAKRATQLKTILIGAKVPELIMPDSNNVWQSSYQFNTKYTIMWFWDPDCGHCRTETPKLRDLYNTLGRKLDFEVFAVSTDPDVDRWKKYIRENELSFMNVGGHSANIDYYKAFDLYATPVMFIFDRDKKIVAKRLGVDDVEHFLTSYEKMLEMKKNKE